MKGNIENSDHGIMSKSINTDGYENISVSFDYRINKSLEADDFFFGEWFDGSNWQTVAAFTLNSAAEFDSGDADVSLSATLPGGADDLASFAFRFRAVMDAGNDEVRIDNFNISGDAISVPTDTDGDGIADESDNCPSVSNAGQTNTDGAGDGGDACDTDDDNDGILDSAPDNCPLVSNADQADDDEDGTGDACDTAEDQTITIDTPAPASAAYGDVFLVAATSDSTLEVTYSSEGSCTNTGNSFTMTASTGTCTVKYNQAGSISFNPAPEETEEVTATVRSITVTADNKAKVYGESDPDLTYQITGGSLVDGDSFSGEISRDEGEDVGTYDINQGDLALSADYDLTFTEGDFVIGQAVVNVEADAKSKTYGNSDPEFTYTFDPALEEGDTFAGALERVLGEGVGLYAILQGTLTAGGNYDISYTGENLTINPREITVTADAQTKTEGELDPELTYQITAGSLVEGDSLIGTLARDPGETPGTYAITIGSLSAGENYEISFTSANLTIEAVEGDTDADNDGVDDDADNCPSTLNEDQANADEDSQGNACDDDDDNDGDSDVEETACESNSLSSESKCPVEDNEEDNQEENNNDDADNTSGNTPIILGSGSAGGSTSGGAVLGAERFIFTQFMKMGSTDASTNGEVTELQKLLKGLGLYWGEIDGIFGILTDAAVKGYQMANPPLKVDGIVGPLTRAVLNK